MNTEFSLWLCYVKLLVCEPDNNSCHWNLVYCSFPALAWYDLLGFQNENLKIIAIFNFHPINRCAIAEIDEPEQLKTSTKVLIVEDNWFNFSVVAKTFRFKSTFVVYYGFDVETVMQLATNKQVDIIIVNSGYGGKYREVNWTENIRLLKSNPKTAQIPIILKWGGQFMASDRERFSASGVDAFIQADPGNINSLIEEIQYTLSANDSSLNTIINLENALSSSQPVKIQREKESALEFIAFKAFQIYLLIGSVIVYPYLFILRRYKSFRK
ncbi:hypothetical protein [Microcoleus sp. AT9b-C3]|uniref:hypothetical protein n=1 Tax=Microcoleus sp. AT9b-C3 TaxID=2818629 RepID=UPI002FD12109